MKFTKLLDLALTVFIFSGIICGCGNSQQQTVSLDGSTSMEKLIGYIGEAYTEENKDVKIAYNPTGSSSGIQAVRDGRCDIGLSSRKLTAAELEYLNGTTVALEGIAVIVNSDNPVSDITIEQLAQIYTGKITNWRDIGGNDLPIVCIGREAASGTRDGFEDAIGASGLCSYSQELTSTGDIVQTVYSNPNAIGYASTASVGEKVRTLPVDGILPSDDTVLSGEYKISRSFILVTSKDKALNSAAQNFYDYITSTSADDNIRKSGAVPVEK